MHFVVQELSQRTSRRFQCFSRCSSVWLERSLWEREVGGSNPLTLTSNRGRPRRPAGDRAVTGGNDETPSTSARIETRLGTSSLQVWLSGRASRRQRGNRGVESRHLLQRPGSTTVVQRFSKPQARVQFSTGARRTWPHNSARIAFGPLLVGGCLQTTKLFRSSL